MKQQLQERLVDRVLAHLERKSTDTGEPGSADVDRYTSEARLQQEIELIFRRQPLAVAHASRLRSSGDFLAIEVAGQPVLLVQSDEGSISAFLNVCRHRGTRVVWEPHGSCRKSFACPYHGWTYGRDGCLLGAPHAHGFPDLEQERPSLVRLPASVRAGFVFVGGEPPAFDELAEDLIGFGLPESAVFDPRSLERNLNWKLAIDIFLEAYHLKTTHPDTIYGMFFDNLGLVDPFGPHTRNVFPKRTIRELASQPRDSWRIREHANVLYHLFPNTLILVEPDHAAVLHAYPLGTDRCRIDSYTLVPSPPDSEKARGYWEKNNAILYGAIEEDFAMGESIQSGARSGANQRFLFGRFEHALTHFHRSLDDVLDR